MKKVRDGGERESSGDQPSLTSRASLPACRSGELLVVVGATCAAA